MVMISSHHRRRSKARPPPQKNRSDALGQELPDHPPARTAQGCAHGGFPMALPVPGQKETADVCARDQRTTPAAIRCHPQTAPSILHSRSGMPEHLGKIFNHQLTAATGRSARDF